MNAHMPMNGVIFSDGIEQDFLHFNSVAITHVGLADVSAQIVVREMPAPGADQFGRLMRIV